jgi:hypothetical protein
MMYLSRRSLLTATGAAALTAPLRGVRAAVSPRRLICIFTPNGIHGENGNCSTIREDGSSGGPAFGTETDFRFGPYYEPLTAVKNHTIALSRLTWAGPKGWGHIGGSRGPFTAWKGDTANDLPQSPSVDQFIAGELLKLGNGAARRNVHYAINVPKIGPTYSPFWSEKNLLAAPTTDPVKAFDDLFAGLLDTMPGQGPDLTSRRAALARVIGDCERLATRVGNAGRAVLDTHCANLKAFDTQIANTMMAAGSCRAPQDKVAAIKTIDHNSPDNYPALTEYFFDLITAAFACDLTRVASFAFGNGASRLRLPFLNLGTAKQVDGYTADDHHTWTHHFGSGAEKTAALTKFNLWWSHLIAKLVTRLINTNDAAGRPLIESTMVLWLNEYGTGCQTGHDLVNIPGFLFTGASEIKTNRFLRLNHKYAEHKALLTSMCHFMGLSGVRDFGYRGSAGDKSFGSQDTEGPLAALYR